MDLFPTLVDLCGLRKVPDCPQEMDTSGVDACVEGKSLADVINDGSGDTGESEVVLVQQERYMTTMGYSIVTQAYRCDCWLGIRNKYLGIKACTTIPCP